MSPHQYIGLNLGATDEAAHRHAEISLLGFWVFLMSDAVIFALLFATYGVQLGATAGGPTPASEFKIGSALAETLLLLSSSFTFGLGSIAMKHQRDARDAGALLIWLGITLLLGLGFLSLECRDFVVMFKDGAYPTRSGFLSAFFALVPLHGLHVLAGSIWLTVLAVQIRLLGCDQQVKINVLRLGLFWHFLDVIWIAIFSIVYLNGLIR